MRALLSGRPSTAAGGGEMTKFEHGLFDGTMHQQETEVEHVAGSVQHTHDMEMDPWKSVVSKGGADTKG